MLQATIRFDFIVGNPHEGSHIRFVFVGILADISLVSRIILAYPDWVHHTLVMKISQIANLCWEKEV